MPILSKFGFLELAPENHNERMLAIARQTRQCSFVVIMLINPDGVLAKLRELAVAGLKNPYLEFEDEATAY